MSGGGSRLAAGLLVVFLLGFFPFIAYCFVSPGQALLPAGCDEFGYLQLARAFEAGRVFDCHANRPFDAELVPHLIASGFAHDDYGKLIAPHAYHLDPATGKVINQYPPGTSYALSHLAIHERYLLFPPLSMVLLLLPVLAVFLIAGNRQAWAFKLAMAAIVAMTCLFAPPFRYGYEAITSIAPTYGLLIAAGFLLRNHPRWALLLLGTTTLFRVANMIVVVPVILLIAARRYMGHAGERRPAVSTVIKTTVVDGTMVLLGGFGLHLLYVWALLGSPFRFTYSKTDQAWTSASDLWLGFEYYFDASSGWLWSHVVVVGLLLVAAWGDRRTLGWVGLCLLVPAVNYAFYVSHKIQIPYYPYASALLLIGVLVEVLDSGEGLAAIRQRITVAGGFAILCLLPLITVPYLRVAPAFAEQAALYRRVFSPYDVVWAELHSGTVEYVADTAGFRYGWGTVAARVAVMRFLRREGYRQAVHLADLEIDDEAVVAELNASSIPFTERRTRLGRLIVIGTE